MSSICDNLNDRQKEAVLCTEGPLLILAGAGSGKTRVLTHRIAYLIAEKNVNPFNICAITFTNKAAGEMRERIDKLVGYGSESIWVSTFHSSCARILRRFADRIGYDNNFTIYDADDSRSVMKEVCKALNIDTSTLKEKTILNAISAAKDKLINDTQYANEAGYDYTKQRISAAYREYQALLRNRNAMDFDDLIINTVELFMSCPDVLADYQRRFEYVCVDEYQDTNQAQFRLVELMAGGKRNLCVVGDDDQSIYGFRGADIRNILDFEKVYPDAKVVRLEQNYRSSQNILDAANSVIDNNRGRKKKRLWTDAGEGEPVHFEQFDSAPAEAAFVADTIGRGLRKKRSLSDYAILYRTNAQSRLFEERLVIEGIPYQIVGGINFYARKEIKDLLSYLKTIDNGRDDLAVKRILNVPKRSIGNATVEKIEEFAGEYNLSFLDAVLEADQIKTLGRSAAKVESFADLILSFREKLGSLSLEELLDDIMETTGYRDHLEKESETKEEFQSRMENVGELISKVKAFSEEREDATLTEFLAEVALVADIDELDEEQERVLLMTVHGAKGLEFDTVFMAGMEDGVFPGYMALSSGSSEDIEEERRLCYVGITRAKRELYITCAAARMIHGQIQRNPVSRFISEIPPALLDKDPARRTGRYGASQSSPYGTFGSGGSGSSYGSYSSYEEEKKTASLFKIPYETPGTRTLPKPSPVRKPKPSVTPVSAKPYLAVADAGAKASAAKGSGRADYNVGDRVLHHKFGEGVVTAMEPGARDVKVSVDFDDCGTKVMYAAFAKLVKV